MILVPEIETIVLLVPRTGSTSLLRAVMSRYSKAKHLFHHMEADGVPQECAHWRKVGVVRHPIDRLWSFFKHFYSDHGVSFNEWLAMSHDVLMQRPEFHLHRMFRLRHAIPENRKSQWYYIRPDLGTVHYSYKDLCLLHRDLDITDHVPPERLNASDPTSVPELTPDARHIIKTLHGWDMENC